VRRPAKQRRKSRRNRWRSWASRPATPIRTAAQTPAAPSEPGGLLSPRLIAAAAAYAAAELLLGLTIGGFFALGRAEALVFLALRPWLLVAAAALVAQRDLRSRVPFYALALSLAATAETLLLVGLGAGNPWPEAAKALIGGAMLALAADLIVQIARRWLGNIGRPLAVAVLAGLLLLPGALQPYEALVLGAERPSAADRPELMLMTALPIIWGEGGAFDPDSRPAESYRMLEREFRVRPLDILSKETLTGRLLLLAQPRALAPEELVALDTWVRRGGRVLILTDPALDWPSALPLGDIRRPPPVGLLGPLLAHWGVRLEPRDRDVPAITHAAVPGREMRLVMTAPGQLVAPDCRPFPDGFLRECDIGKGKAMLIADADLLRDDLWAPFGAERHLRMADNPLVVAAWLDRLAGVERERRGGDVEWLRDDADRPTALMLAAIPLLLAAAAAATLLRLRRA